MPSFWGGFFTSFNYHANFSLIAFLQFWDYFLNKF